MTNIDPPSLHANLQDMLRDSLAKGQNPRLTVTSNSMTPLFWADDQVILEASQPEQLHAGDIVTIVDNFGFLTHRIWAVHGNKVLTRGDHALVFDEFYTQDAILGRVIGRSHNRHTLSFQTGIGQWLNKHLAALVRKEYRWLTGSQEAPINIGDEPVLTSIQATSTRTKLVHRLVFGWAIFITFVVNLATRIKPGETKI